MYVAHVILTSDSCPKPVRVDADLVQDGLWAHAPHDLGIEHIRSKAGPGHIDIFLFLRSTVHGGLPDERAVLATIRKLPCLRDWCVIFADSE